MTPSMPRSLPFAVLPAAGRAAQLPYGPELELVLVALRECQGSRFVGGLSVHGNVVGEVAWEGGSEPAAHEGHGQPRDVDSDPPATQPVRGHDGGAAAAEGVQHHVPLVGGGPDNALQQRLRLLGRVAKVFSRTTNGSYVCPH